MQRPLYDVQQYSGGMREGKVFDACTTIASWLICMTNLYRYPLSPIPWLQPFELSHWSSTMMASIYSPDSPKHTQEARCRQFGQELSNEWNFFPVRPAIRNQIPTDKGTQDRGFYSTPSHRGTSGSLITPSSSYSHVGDGYMHRINNMDASGLQDILVFSKEKSKAGQMELRMAVLEVELSTTKDVSCFLFFIVLMLHVESCINSFSNV